MEDDALVGLAGHVSGLEGLHRREQGAADALDVEFLRGAHVDQDDLVALERGPDLFGGPVFQRAVFGLFGFHAVSPQNRFRGIFR